MQGDVAPVDLIACVLLVGAAIAVSAWLRLGLGRGIATAVARGAAQLLLAGALLALVVEEGTWIGWSFVWVAVIVAFAAQSVHARVPELPHARRAAAVANGAAGVIGLGVLFASGAFPLEGRTLVPLAGMVVGNAYKCGMVAAELLVHELRTARPVLEARLALGQPATEALRPALRRIARTAVTSPIEQVRGLGVVFLPGAMTGLVLAGVDPLDAILVQLALMYVILAAAVASTLVTLALAARELTTPDHRIVPLPSA